MASAKYKRGPDNYFTTHAWDGTYNDDGTKHYKTLRSKKSSKDLERIKEEFCREVEAGKILKKTDATFLDYSRQWKQVYKSSKSYNTKKMYENLIEKHFIALGDIRLQDTERIHLQILLNNAEGKTRTQEQIQMAFKQVIKSAVSDKLFSKDVAKNIFNNVDPVKYQAPENRPLTENEKQAVFKADFKEQDKILVYLIYGCGLRREEVLALTVFDFNMKKKEVNINKAHEFVDGKPKQKDPKSVNGYRSVPIPMKVFPAVESYVSRKKASGNSYLFVMRNGEPVTKSSYDKAWARILRAMQAVSKELIVGLTDHVFRHNFCTNLCYQIPKISIKRIAQLMGDTESMVLRVYNHMIMEKEDAEGAVNDAMNF